MENLLVCFLMPFLLWISVFFALLTKDLMRINLGAANVLIAISISALTVTTVDFLLFKLGLGDQYDLLGDVGRFFMYFFASPALAIISTSQWKPSWGRVRTFIYIISTITLCVLSIYHMHFYSYLRLSPPY